MFFSTYKKPVHVLVGREDAMGDVVLALPVCGMIKKYYPGCRITFLGRTYTKAIALSSIHVDDFMNYDEWAGKTTEEINSLIQSKNIDTVIHLLPAKPIVKQCYLAKIRIRIGSASVLQHWKYCNRLVPLSRKKSRLNEAQLNIKLLKALNINQVPSREDIPLYYGFSRLPVLHEINRQFLDPFKFNLILHPLSNKNAQEWGLHNFSSLVNLISLDQYKLFITGSVAEREILSPWISAHREQVTDLSGRLDTEQLIAFIAAADGLIASSTGPAHIAAAAGIHTLGLYENKWVKRGERWGPLGKKAGFLQCTDDDMNTITPEMVMDRISSWKK